MRVYLDLCRFPRRVESGTLHKRRGHLYRVRLINRHPGGKEAPIFHRFDTGVWADVERHIVLHLEII